MSKLEIDLVSHAEELIPSGPGKPNQVKLRRSISSAYYSAWHCICSAIGKKFPSNQVRMLRRVPSHSHVKKIAGKFKGNNSAWMKDIQQCNDRMSQMCEDFITLQLDRHSADYDTFRSFRKSDALISIDRAKRLADTIKWAEGNCQDQLDAFLLDCLSVKFPNREGDSS